MGEEIVLFKQREQLIFELIEFNNNESNRICSLDGAWGSGKSFFIEKFIEHIKDEINKDEVAENNDNQVTDEIKNEKSNFDILKFDAWENQGNGNINAIFLEFLFEELESREYDGKPYFEYMKDHKKEWVSELADIISASLLPKPVSKIVDKIKKSYQEFQDRKAYEAYGNQMLNQLLDEKSFYDILVEMLIKEERYLIIIDELDRCEPNFAMEVIKKIIYLNKKLKDKGNDVNFMISINKIEFANLLTGYYGVDYDTHQYFDKIFDYEFALPDAKTAYEYLQMMIPNSTEYKYEIEYHVNSEIRNRFEKLNYRKLNILVEKLKEQREKAFDREDLRRGFTPGYSYDRTRFIVEILKLSDYKEYMKIKDAIIRLKRQHNYSNFFRTQGIALKEGMKNSINSFDDIKLIGKYFTKLDHDDVTVDCSELVRDSNFEESEIEDLKKQFSLCFLVLLLDQFRIC